MIFPKPLVIFFFSLTYRAIAWQAFPYKSFFSLEISLQDIFSEITPSKVKWLATKMLRDPNRTSVTLPFFFELLLKCGRIYVDFSSIKHGR